MKTKQGNNNKSELTDEREKLYIFHSSNIIKIIEPLNIQRDDELCDDERTRFNIQYIYIYFD